MQRVRIVAGLLLMLAATWVAGCASTGGAPSGDGDSSRLTSEEIRASGLPNAYELVSRLRRAWLRRDPRTGGAVAVYMDNRNLGGAESLRDIPTVSVAELRLLDYDDAVRRWGPAVEGRVIVVMRQR